MARGCSRRTFVVKAAGAVALPIIGQPLGGCAYGYLKGEDGPAELLFDLANEQFAPLTEIGGMVGADAGRRLLLLVRVDAERVLAFDRICSHEACDMSPDDSGLYDLDTQTLVCTCHWTGYGLDGEVKYGPAEVPLPVYSVEFDVEAGTGVVIIRPGASEEADA